MMDEFGAKHCTHIDFGKVTLESLLVVLLVHLRALDEYIPKGPDDLRDIIDAARQTMNTFYDYQFESVIQKVNQAKVVPAEVRFLNRRG